MLAASGEVFPYPGRVGEIKCTSFDTRTGLSREASPTVKVPVKKMTTVEEVKLPPWSYARVRPSGRARSCSPLIYQDWLSIQQEQLKV